MTGRSHKLLKKGSTLKTPYIQCRLGKKHTLSLKEPKVTKWSDRNLANTIWLLVKGIPLPKHYTEKDCEQIIKRYWHRAMEVGNG